MNWFYHGNNKLQIDQKDDLDLRERLLEGQFASWIQENVDRAVREYSGLPQTKNGKVSNTDYARELSVVYSESWENRLKWGDAVHEPASALAEEVYHRRLNDPRLQKGKTIFTAGGPGAGKSFTLQKKGGELAGMADVIYDTTLANEDSAEEKIRSAIDENKLPVIFYVHRPAELAAELVFIRGLEEGRIVPLEVIAHSHFEAQKTLFHLQNEFSKSTLTIFTFDNSGGEDDVYETTVDSIREQEYSDFKSVLESTKEGLNHAKQRAYRNSPLGKHKIERVYEEIT